MGQVIVSRQLARKDWLCANVAQHRSGGSSELIPAGSFYCKVERNPAAARLATRNIETDRFCHECAVQTYARYRGILAKLSVPQRKFMASANGLDPNFNEPSERTSAGG